MLLKELFKTVYSDRAKDIRLKAAKCLQFFRGKDAWNKVKNLAYTEKDEEIKKVLRDAERQIRDNNSMDKQQFDLKSKERHRKLKEKMWKPLR